MEPQARLNQVFAYIEDNLDGDLSLDRVSEEAFFSPFHFHRVFKAMTGETLNEFVTRRRIERAASYLINQQNKPIAEIAFQVGYHSDSAFSRAFKGFYGCSPKQFRAEHPNKFSKIRQLLRKNGEEYPDTADYLRTLDNLIKWTNMNAKIEVVNTPKMEFASIACLGMQNLQLGFQKLMQWAIPKGIMAQGEIKMATIFYDSFKTTARYKVRMNACMLLNEPIAVEGEIGLTTLEGGKHIKGSYEIGINDFEKAWTGLFIWINENGYKKATTPPFEIYHNNFNEHPEKKCIVDLYIAVE